jgi:hypothetical protein
VLATPKTDIIQAVGRILRVKHARPLVVDIVDSHEVFLSQWQKRRKYYQSNKYTVMHTKSHLYVLDKWDDTAKASAKEVKASATKEVKAGATKVCTVKASAKEVKALAKTCTPGNLLANGAAAAARYINTFGRLKPQEEDF